MDRGSPFSLASSRLLLALLTNVCSCSSTLRAMSFWGLAWGGCGLSYQEEAGGSPCSRGLEAGRVLGRLFCNWRCNRKYSLIPIPGHNVVWPVASRMSDMRAIARSTLGAVCSRSNDTWRCQYSSGTPGNLRGLSKIECLQTVVVVVHVWVPTPFLALTWMTLVLFAICNCNKPASMKGMSGFCSCKSRCRRSWSDVDNALRRR